MKTFQSSRCLLADINRVLTDNNPSFHHSPLEQVADLLIAGRHYTWVGVYLSVDDHSPPLLEDARQSHPGQLANAGTRKKIVISMKIAGREVGHLGVESERENAFGGAERVLLEQVAGLLARFLTGPGKYLVLNRTGASPNHSLKRMGMSV